MSPPCSRPARERNDRDMLIFRLVGYLLALAGLGFLIVDGARSIAAGDLILTRFGQSWYDLDRASLNGAQALVQRYLHPYVWDPVIATILQWPTFAVALGLSLLFVVISRPRRRGTGAAWR
jgi:hypothetical protein